MAIAQALRRNVTLKSLFLACNDLGDYAVDAIYEANRVDFDLVRTTEKFATADGGEFELDLAEPGLLIEHVVRSSDALRELFTFVLQRNTQPLKVSIYVSTAGRRRAGQR